MGSLIYVDEYATFIGLSFLAMALGGIGAGINSTCSLAIISSFYPDQKELYIGILEAGSGIGLLTGPLFGGILYQIGGYVMPFWTLAILFISLYPVMLKYVKIV